MKIIIIGAGFTGTKLAQKLIDEKNDVVLIDSNEDVIRHASNHLDCSVVVGSGNNLATLEAVGISSADALITLTDSDEFNMITCSLVDGVYPDLLKIARVRDYAYYRNSKETISQYGRYFGINSRPLYGIDYMVNPDVEAAEKIIRAIEHGAVSDVLAFDSQNELATLNIEEGSTFDGVSLKNVHSIMSDCPFVIAYVETEKGTELPSGSTILFAGNRIGVIAKKSDIPRLLKESNAKVDPLKKIAILGAERIGMIVSEHIAVRNSGSVFKNLFAKNAEKRLSNLFIIDDDEVQTKEASDRFEKAKILCGDVTDERLVLEERLNECDLFVAVTKNFERNIVTAAYMKSLGVGKTVSLAASSQLGEIGRKLGIDVVVPLRDAIIDSIMSHLRGKNVLAIHTVGDGSFEIIECDIVGGCKVAGKKLKEISRPGEFLVLLVRAPESSDYDLPTGDTILEKDSHVVLIMKTGDEKTLRYFGK